ncbi:hypothetical protein GEV33_000546 [Tenebrio molitor]|uniref:Uncharacterized protein n=1 Tax=Tenebrio molitor TaxID=7067 RepID=A0A8J6LHF8_TENMO|nr:hypothetical protein GEV33_000546 [Tenebrio molitor]
MRFINILSADNPQSSPKSSMRFCRTGGTEVSSLILSGKFKNNAKLNSE